MKIQDLEMSFHACKAVATSDVSAGGTHANFNSLGRCFRGPGRGRGDDRPHRPPCRRDQPARLKLPLERHRDHDVAFRPAREHRRINTHGGLLFREQIRPTFHKASTASDAAPAVARSATWGAPSFEVASRSLPGASPGIRFADVTAVGRNHSVMFHRHQSKPTLSSDAPGDTRGIGSVHTTRGVRYGRYPAS